MYHFCTYFDENYLLRGVALYHSLLRHCDVPFRFYALCLDSKTFDALVNIGEESIVPIRLVDVERWDEDLLVAKNDRSLIEYYFTLSPVLPLYVLKKFEVDIVTYLDADLMFFSSPAAIYEELSEASIFITEHRFSDRFLGAIKYGRFNVQCQSFRNSDVGLECLGHWRRQCLDWCYDRLENGKYADQKYLEEWPGRYGKNVVICKNFGVGAAPWNIASLPIHTYNEDIFIDESPLVFYHFAGFSMLSPNWIITGAYSGFKLFEHASLFYRYRRALMKSRLELLKLGIQTNLYAKTRYKTKLLKLLLIAVCKGGILYVSNNQ